MRAPPWWADEIRLIKNEQPPIRPPTGNTLKIMLMRWAPKTIWRVKGKAPTLLVAKVIAGRIANIHTFNNPIQAICMAMTWPPSGEPAQAGHSHHDNQVPYVSWKHFFSRND